MNLQDSRHEICAIQLPCRVKRKDVKLEKEGKKDFRDKVHATNAMRSSRLPSVRLTIKWQRKEKFTQ